MIEALLRADRRRAAFARGRRRRAERSRRRPPAVAAAGTDGRPRSPAAARSGCRPRRSIGCSTLSGESVLQMRTTRAVSRHLPRRRARRVGARAAGRSCSTPCSASRSTCARCRSRRSSGATRAPSASSRWRTARRSCSRRAAWTTQLDRVILDGIAEAIAHLLSNAVAHGIESPDERERAGKPRSRADRPAGRAARKPRRGRGGRRRPRRRAEVLARAREAGIARRACSAPPASRPPPRCPRSRAAASGSTRSRRTSSRSAAASRSRALRARDTTTTLLLPYSVALTRVLLVERDGQRYAVPLASVEEVAVVESALSLLGEQALELHGRAVPLADLARLLGAPSRAAAGAPRAVVVRSSEGRQGDRMRPDPRRPRGHGQGPRRAAGERPRLPRGGDPRRRRDRAGARPGVPDPARSARATRRGPRSAGPSRRPRRCSSSTTSSPCASSSAASSRRPATASTTARDGREALRRDRRRPRDRPGRHRRRDARDGRHRAARDHPRGPAAVRAAGRGPHLAGARGRQGGAAPRPAPTPTSSRTSSTSARCSTPSSGWSCADAVTPATVLICDGSPGGRDAPAARCSSRTAASRWSASRPAASTRSSRCRGCVRRLSRSTSTSPGWTRYARSRRSCAPTRCRSSCCAARTGAPSRALAALAAGALETLLKPSGRRLTAADRAVELRRRVQRLARAGVARRPVDAAVRAPGPAAARGAGRGHRRVDRRPGGAPRRSWRAAGRLSRPDPRRPAHRRRIRRRPRDAGSTTQIALPVAPRARRQPRSTPGVWFAPDGAHLTVTRSLRIALDASGRRRPHRPSVDRLLESMAAALGAQARRGRPDRHGRATAPQGVAAVTGAGGLAIAQDEASAAVFGMPRAAAASRARGRWRSPRSPAPCAGFAATGSRP